MDNTFLDYEDSAEIAETSEILEELVDLLIDMGLSDEKITEVFDALESGEHKYLDSVLPDDTTLEEVSEIEELFKEYLTALNQDDGYYDDPVDGGSVTEAVLTIAQRRKRAMTMRKFKSKMKNARQRMSKRAAPIDAIKRRARRAAIVTMRKKVAGSQGGDYANLNPSQKMVIDKRVAQRKAAIDRLAARLVVKTRQADRERLSSRGQKNESFTPPKVVDTFTHPFKSVTPDVDPDNNDYSAPPLGWYDGVVKDRWHKHFTANGGYDRRFKMFKAVDVLKHKALELNESNIFNLISEAEMLGIDVEQVLSNVQGDITESADAQASVVSAIAKSYNIAESLTAIAENRDPQLVCESTGESCMFISRAQMKAFEGLCDKLFKKFNIEFTFTKHFAERMSDSRNTPCLTLRELGEFVKKMYADSGKKLKDQKDTEAVLKDLQTDINIPIAVNYNRKEDTFEVVGKTIMRKKNFRTPNPVVTYK